MTDASLAPIVLEPLGAGPEYADINVWLPQLFLETSRATGALVIENRKFVGCLIEGPAVLLPLEGCTFDGCNMGEAHGDPRTLMLQPGSPQRVAGPIPLRNCHFVNCRFLGVGFTGAPAFLDNMATALAGASQ
ncbi:hypothetical protein [Brevundimonas sp.]|uniref:hypothetical protein n=1 Tax=Brevundimonas sp. TaxID=1871086 RepID=UPI003D6DA5A2